ncbi:tyrosine-type recombinase/integrase [Bacillus testis]|uniref:tyrosine-type recombinase/integrase n=1 Tax=Bacillus testis TaxID=1622072 RepID=UPI00067EAB39|nr:tyrosine-type recombinase/integrase [Bacillus testis]
MEYVVALRKKEEIESMKKYLLEHSYRDYLLFVLGINTGMKLSEMLKLQKQDVMNQDGRVYSFIRIDSGQPVKLREVYLNSVVKESLLEYASHKELKMNDYLFASPKTNKPISRQQAYRIIHDAAVKAGLSEKIGTHTMRKTFGYHAYKQGVAISLLQRIFHHSTKSETLKYLGISKDEDIKTEIDVHL